MEFLNALLSSSEASKREYEFASHTHWKLPDRIGPSFDFNILVYLYDCHFLVLRQVLGIEYSRLRTHIRDETRESIQSDWYPPISFR